tara:strand:+ start:447 stop:713 length:267 start_codon:yes stop_codon:yes gene_type:complete
MKRDKALKTAEGLVSEKRASVYGDARLNHQRIANMWSVIFGVKVTVPMVYLAMVAVKISRLINTPDHEDSWIDICGYGALGAEEKDDK